MTRIDALRAKLAHEEEILERVRPELDRLKIEIGPWIRAGSNGIPMAEPVEARRRYTELQAELWQARSHIETRRELGEAESRARAHVANIALLDTQIAELQAKPRVNDARASRLDEEIARLQRYRANEQRLLDLLGEPTTAPASEIVA